MIRLFRHREPNADEVRVFTSLAADASSLGTLLRRTHRIKIDSGDPVDLGDGDEREMLAAALRSGAAQHVRAGEDLLELLERLNRMVEVSIGKRDPQRRTELGIQLLRGIAVCELLESESRDRFPRHAPLAKLAAETSTALARGYLRALGRDVPAPLRRVFPRFFRAVRTVASQTDVVPPSLFRRWALSPKRSVRPAEPPPRTERLDTPTTTS